jgi:hypothetical protein
VTRDGNVIAVTAGCMDRQEPLAQSLPSWLALPEADHVVVVDWSSCSPLRESLAPHPKLTVVRVDGQEYWHNSVCHNLELQVASALNCDVVLRVDADVVVARDFIASHPVLPKTFYALDCHSVPPHLEHKKSLCGTLYTQVSDVLLVGGYNERLRQYGYEDEDLFGRLAATGLRWRQPHLDSLEHIPHSDAMRVEHLDTLDAPPSVIRLGPKAVAEHYIYKSLALAQSQPWGPSDRRILWDLTRIYPGYWEARPCA